MPTFCRTAASAGLKILTGVSSSLGVASRPPDVALLKTLVSPFVGKIARRVVDQTERLLNLIEAVMNERGNSADSKNQTARDDGSAITAGGSADWRLAGLLTRIRGN